MKVIYVYRPGCPYCNKINPEWERAKELFQCKFMKIRKASYTYMVSTVTKFQWYRDS